MPTVNEAMTEPTALGAALQAGVDDISLRQTINFKLYVRQVLPLDGYVFWVNATLLSPAAIAAARATQGAASTPAFKLSVMGSLHYGSEVRQEQEANYVSNRVVFTAEKPVQDLNAIGPNFLYIATFDNIRFAFSGRGSWYQQADLWHYNGHAVFSTLDTQIIDDVDTLDPTKVIVSNSLPAWLATNSYGRETWPSGPPYPTNPPYPILIPFPNIVLYPSFLVPQNLPPAYGVVHVTPDATEAVAVAPVINQISSHYQQAKDRVEVTLFGVDSATAFSFVDALIQYTLDTAAFGITNMPIVRDERVGQTEILAIAQKKRITFDVSYVQGTVRDIAQQMIVTATFVPQPDGILITDVPLPPPIGA